MLLATPRRDGRALASFSHDVPVGKDGQPVSPLEALTLQQVLETPFPTDAHFTTYSTPSLPFRLAKVGLPHVLAAGYSPQTFVVCIDIDLHHLGYAHPDGSSKAWTDLSPQEAQDARTRVFSARPTVGAPTACYATLHGLRALHALALPVPTQSVEPLIGRFIASYREAGVPADLACRDWTRLFRAPRVTRPDGLETWTQPWFFEEYHLDDPERYYVPTPEDLVPLPVVPPGPTARRPDQPSPDEAEAEVWSFQDGKRVLTPLAQTVERALRGSPAYAHVFGNTPLACGKGARHDKMVQMIGLLVAQTRPIPDASPILAYGLALQMVKLFEQDEDWTHKAWDPVISFWQADEQKPSPSTAAAQVDDIPDFNRSDKGHPFPTRANFSNAIRRLGLDLWHDSFSGRDMIDDQEITDIIELNLRIQVEDLYGFPQIRPETWREFIQHTTSTNSRHPARQYFDSLTWDNTPRLRNLLTRYFGAEPSSPPELYQQFGQLIMVAAVRRARRAPCKFDEVLVLEGPQGGYKSTGLRALCPDPKWFLDDLPLDSDPKTIIEQTRGKLIVELAEMTGARKAQIDRVKNMLSRQVDRARAAYGRRAEDVPRQFVFFATTNDSTYLRDQTGNRRFWPVAVNHIDAASIAADRDQLWAEAAYLEARNISIRLDPSLYVSSAELQDLRTADNPFVTTLQDALGMFADQPIAVISNDLWECLNIHGADKRALSSSQFGEACRTLGFSKGKQHQINGEINTYRFKNCTAPNEAILLKWSSTAKKFIQSRTKVTA